MDRPKLEKPRVELWKTDDQLLAKFLTHLDKKALNAAEFEIRDPFTNQMIKYDKVCENIQSKYIGYRWVNILKSWFLYMPIHMRTIRNELFAIFKRIVLNTQEKVNYIEALEKYADHLEKIIEKLEKQSEKAKPGAEQKDIPEPVIVEAEPEKVFIKPEVKRQDPPSKPMRNFN